MFSVWPVYLLCVMKIELFMVQSSFGSCPKRNGICYSGRLSYFGLVRSTKSGEHEGLAASLQKLMATSTGHDIQQITDTYTAPKRPGKDVKSAFLSTARLSFQEEPRFLKGPVKIKVVVKENLEIIGEVSSKGSIIFPSKEFS
ncbi:hypothetical protein FSP39_024921 [Pinctada imbricata]|uniref:Uncharacterized protein n=1 Tax=Pinctada imbricata TaxID=66713 RepID=A0AA88YPK7_PINIB|nr:hypothetical protein FSP39_024921 [Pinctada imbricata]